MLVKRAQPFIAGRVQIEETRATSSAQVFVRLCLLFDWFDSRVSGRSC
jgi:hypothetical protein